VRCVLVIIAPKVGSVAKLCKGVQPCGALGPDEKRLKGCYEAGKSRVRHLGCPPIWLWWKGDIFTSYLRRSKFRNKGSRQLVWISDPTTAYAAPSAASIAPSVFLVPRCQVVQIHFGVEVDGWVNEAVFTIHSDFDRLIWIQHVVHGNPPWGPARICAPRAPLRTRSCACARFANMWCCSPRDPWAVQGLTIVAICH